MRETILALLVANALAPAAASAQDRSHERGWNSQSDRTGQRDNESNAREQRPERGQQRLERASRAERAQRPERVEPSDPVNRQADRKPRLNQSGDLDRAIRSDRMQGIERSARAERPVPTGQANSDLQPVEQAQDPVTVRNDRPDSLVDGFRQVARDSAAGQDNDRDDHHKGGWKHDWRKDKRYDWWYHRSRHSSLYRLGYYRDPYGWGYRRWTAGYNLWPSYYGSGFWLSDPWMYRLPPAYGQYRWIRYYDDALLVDIYTGHVVDVVYNFFW